jgi:hypothetical protein
MKGGCSPQNTLRIEQSFQRCKQIFAKFPRERRGRKLALSDGPILEVNKQSFRPFQPSPSCPASRKAVPESGRGRQFFDFGYYAVQLVDQIPVAMLAERRN